MKKLLLYLLVLPLLLLLLASCEKEKDDFITKPDAKSICIKGVASTSGGQPLPNIEVQLDYTVARLFAVTVYHKAKATTDKEGKYVMSFNLSDDELKSLTVSNPDANTNYNLQFVMDLRKLDDKTYLLPTDNSLRNLQENKLTYPYFRLLEPLQAGKVYEENIFIPRKQMVNLAIESNGAINTKEKFAVRHRVKYGLENQVPSQFDYEGGTVDFYIPVTLKNSHSQLVQVSCAVSEGSKVALYRMPEGEANYKEFSGEVEVPAKQTGEPLTIRTY